MNKSVYSYKVLELIAKEVGGYFTGYEIVKILEKMGIPREKIQYPNTKWWTINEAFKYIKETDTDPENTISKLIMDFLHPLNHNLNEESAGKLADKLQKYLKYDNFYIEDTGSEYLVLSDEEMEEMHAHSPEEEERSDKDRKLYEKKIKESGDIIKELRDSHQMYMDIVEIFCQNIKKPTKDLNDAYLFLSKNIEDAVNNLSFKHFKLPFYKPFKNDLYSAELEWNGTGNLSDLRLGPRLSWDVVRPSLYRMHSEIIKIQNLSERDTVLTDEEKRREEIIELISQKRVQKIPTNEIVKKMEILHKYEKTTPSSFYVTKKDDDFYYKGLHVLASKKKNDYYKVFCALYAKLPEGGEVQYKELIAEIKSRMPEQKNKTVDEMRKFIQRNLTDRSNGFMRYAKIAETEDNGKPLISISRGSGVVFNNKMG
jgi:hypothetical protein